MVTILSQDPPAGTVAYGDVEYYDDGSEPLGTVTEIIGGSNSKNIPRQENLVIDPRLTEDNISTQGTFGVSARAYIAGIAESADPVNPVQSAAQYTFAHEPQYLAAINELSADPTIERIAQNEATFSLSPAQVLGEIIKSGIGAGVLADSSQVASNVGLSTGSGVISVEAGAVALTLGAVANAYDAITGNHSVAQVEHRLVGATSNFVAGIISHNS